MSKDPAFLFYDGDAARDVSHMNRLERGCYFDFIQAQRKFHGITIEQARKILGKDFDSCWQALELILTLKDGLYYIEWVRESIEKRRIHAEMQRKRIQDYWDKKKNIPRNNHGISMDIPYANENANAIEDIDINILNTRSNKKVKYLDYVLLTENEYNKLIERYGEPLVSQYMERLNNYVGSKGKKYKSHYHTILAWIDKDKPDYKQKPTQKQINTIASITRFDNKIKQEKIENEERKAISHD